MTRAAWLASRLSSLSARITLLLLVSSLLILGTGSLLMDWRIDNEMEKRFDQSLLAQAQAAIAPIEIQSDQNDPEPATWPLSGMLGASGRIYYEMRCGDRTVALSTPPPPQRPPDWPSSHSTVPRFGKIDYGNHRQLGYVALDFNAPLGEGWNGNEHLREDWGRGANLATSRECSIALLQNRHQLNQILTAVDWILLLGPALALAIALVAVPLIVRRGLRPLHALGERMGDIGPDAPNRRLPGSGIRELDPLVERFNGVLARMDEGLARERQFASGLAHETRTRLAELRALTEVERRYPSGRSTDSILDEIGTIGAELEATVGALLLLTRLQSGMQTSQPQALLIAPWLERISQYPRILAQDRRVGLRIQVAPDLRLLVDPALFELVVGNLLGNACAYAPGDDIIGLSITPAGVSIHNAAPKLEPDDIHRLGERFWRKERPDQGHAGLGLALAQAAATALHWQLSYRLDAGRLHAHVRPLAAPPP